MRNQFQYITLPTDKILLNNNNFRLLAGDGFYETICAMEICDPRTQELLRRYILKKYNITPLIRSITEIGFLPLDNIIVEKSTNGYYVAIEGNRRLTAIKTIIGDINRKVIEVPEHCRCTLDPITVMQFNENKSGHSINSLSIQGVRHVSGAKGWNPYQQGALINQLVSKHNYKYAEVSRILGIHQSRVSVLYKAYCGLCQMLNSTEYGKLANTSLFSCFEQAYIKMTVRNWLGWDDKNKCYTNMKNLNLFYKNISQNNEAGMTTLRAQDVRDYLSSIIENNHAYHLFITGKCNITDAHDIATNSQYILALKKIKKILMTKNHLMQNSKTTDRETIEALFEIKSILETVS